MDTDTPSTEALDALDLPRTPPAAGTELETLLGSLERQRGYVAWKCGGLDSAGLRATLGPSTMTLGGLLKHLALVEDHTLGWKLLGQKIPEPFTDIDWDADRDWEWRTAADDSPEYLIQLWQDAADRARANVATALADGGLDRPGAVAWPDGRTPSLRRLLIDMIEEYARHVGHIDLLRESVDGLVGEDPADFAE
ncbi:MAG TPA: DinB family protein [Actinospica sp.]|nr:DinB family protein [Actinospica sp.]